jgi:hypothetical protein
MFPTLAVLCHTNAYLNLFDVFIVARQMANTDTCATATVFVCACVESIVCNAWW